VITNLPASLRGRAIIEKENDMEAPKYFYFRVKAVNHGTALQLENASDADVVEVVRCKDCKHWTQTTGKMKGYGLGRCDFHDADLVTCNGFCYWAERREENE